MTLKYNLKSLAYLSALGLLFVTSLCFGQADPNNPASPNYRGKSSVINQKKLFTAFGASVGRGMDEFSESFGSYSFSGTYSLGTSSLTLNSDYLHPLDGDTSDMRQWRFEDVELVWNAPSYNDINILGKKITLQPRFTYRAPISEASAAASSYGTFVSTFVGITNYGRFSFILSPQIHLSYHSFETADKVGEIKNVPIALALAGTIRYLVIKNLYLTGSAFYFQGWDYDLGSAPTSGMSSNLYYQATPVIGLTAYTSWRDRVYTNNSLFDGDTSTMGIGVITNF